MLAMLVVATALTRISFVHNKPFDEGLFIENIAKGIFSEDDMRPDFTEQLGARDHEGEIRKRNLTNAGKYDLPLIKIEDKNTKESLYPLKSLMSRQVPELRKRPTYHSDEMDIVDREDHVTQYLADLLVNTDSEITSLQASEIDDDRENMEVREDTFFTFLTGQEKAVEVEGAWSRPVEDDAMNEDSLANFLTNLD